MHDHSDPWAPFALLFAAVLFAGAGIDWHAVAEAAHTAAAYGLALLAALVACAVVSSVARRGRVARVSRRGRPIIGQPAYWGVAA